MGIFDIFKKSDKHVAPAEAPAVPIVENAVKDQPAVPHGYDVLVRPLLTEKAMHSASTGRYVFVVGPKAAKPEIRKSIQKIYNVHVEGVKIINISGKRRRYGRTQGQTSSYKKAIVVLRKGEKLPGIIESVG